MAKKAVAKKKPAKKKATPKKPDRKPRRNREPMAHLPAEFGDDGRLVFHRGWDAAASDRLRWMKAPTQGPTPSADELETMRNRAAELERNDSLVFAAMHTKTVNVVTHKIRPQSQARGDDPAKIAPRFRKVLVTEDQAETARAQLESAWKVFAKHMDASGRLQFEDFAFLADYVRRTRGEILVHKVNAPLEGGRQFRTAFELIECDALETPREFAGDDSVVNGIRYDDAGRATRYYLRKGGGLLATKADYDELDAKDVRHLFATRRVGQGRGIPEIAPCLQSCKDRKDLADATIIKAQNSAALTAVMTTKDPGEVEEDWEHDELTGDDKTYTIVPIHKGAMQFLPHGDTIHEFKSDHPSTTFEPFMAGVKTDIAAGLGISYLSLTRDGRGVNYSTMRGLYLQDRMVYQVERAAVKRYLLDWVWECFCDEAVLSGWADAPNYNARKDLYTAVAWQFGAWGWVDPTKEAEAHALAIESNLSSRAEILASEGLDAEEVIDDNLRLEKYEKDRRAEMGIEAKPPAENVTPEDEDEEATDEG